MRATLHRTTATLLSPTRFRPVALGEVCEELVCRHDPPFKEAFERLSTPLEDEGTGVI